MHNKNQRFLNLQTSRMLANRKADIHILVKLLLWIVVGLILGVGVWFLHRVITNM